ncbi:hypothetical protein BRD19_12555 [Halobacteriales archaeon SW_7_65_23]|nr:MAG: hypothetical protein BRD19_12555 [Halobacteriales archaeon SW_7_65_23]
MAGKRVVLKQDDTIGEDTDNREVLATSVDIADSALSQARGLMFRSSIPDEYALVMEVGSGGLLFSGPSRQVVHMLFVRFPIDVIWLADDEVTRVERMHPWRSIALAKADRILELPAGAADGVSAGDTVVVEDAPD